MLIYATQFLEHQISSDHLLRRIDAVLDLSEIRRFLAPHYPPTAVLRSPELMISMLLIGYAFAISRTGFPAQHRAKFRSSG